MNCFTRRFHFGLVTVLQALQEDYSIYKGRKISQYQNAPLRLPHRAKSAALLFQTNCNKS
jgi:hypothetical protein